MSLKRTVVEVPATVANCGPGFDSVGVAIDLVTRIEVFLEGDSIEVEYEGPWATALADAPRDRTNLLARAFLAAIGPGAPDGVRFVEYVEAPVGRGFGSSASAIVGGILAAQGLGLVPDDGTGLDLAIELEGHPDNVVPCMNGGISISAGNHRVRFDPPSGWMMLVAIAPVVSATSVTRTTLPESYARALVADQAGRAALLGAALAIGDMDALFDATVDHIHQPTRLAAMPDAARVLTSWRDRGLAAFLAGAGPSVAAFIDASHADEVADLVTKLPDGWTARPVDLRPEGARLIR